uniref:Hypoxia-inducible factor 1-alpha-like isoform X2 n=1 Tax=Crassostrea virginica TaxID=6565 RepID=A0A8B8DVU9_CRAVI|nr:hypoxia-inducible factor 1-alpha-like isoform X2 [Crassostrea virginica]
MAMDKTRNSEKRKEKSRDAARCRRGRETEIFSELAEQIPQYSGSHGQLDKASIMRLAISHLKISKIMETQRNNRHAPCEEFDPLYSRALDGFVLILSNEGDLIFISESVSKYLGIQQVDLVGQSIYEFVHPCDHEDITEIFHSNGRDKKKKSSDCYHTFFVRMKCTLTNKGKNVNLKSATYKVIKFSGKLVKDEVKREAGGDGSAPYLLLIGEPIPHPSNIEVPLDRMTFLSRHNMDMKFTYCDDRVKDLLGYNCSDLINKSLFDYHHAMDSEVIDHSYRNLVAKGQVMTGQYRFLAKTGGHVWMITQGTVIYNSRTQKPQCIVCVHYVLSGIENPSLILSTSQQSYSQQVPMLPLEVKLSTEDVFKPRPDNVKVDEFYFPPGTKIPSMKIDESVDLTHLAPTSGDTCVPLIGDKCIQFSDQPMPALKEEPDMFSTRVCSHPTQSPLATPPSVSPAPISPMDYTTPLTPSVVDAMDKFFSAVETYPRNDQANADLDMDMRAPYIPMNKKEDFSLLPPTSDALFSINSDFNPGLFGRTESVFVPKDKLYQDPPKEPRMSIRDMLVGSTAVASIEQPPDTFNLQLKRPLDMNSLEKGPPVKKRFIQDYQEVPKKHSVLMSLLVNGEDPPTGYSVVGRKPPQQPPLPQAKAYYPLLGKGSHSGGKQIAALPQDEEVMETPDLLLQNPDLLAALELFLPNSELM